MFQLLVTKLTMLGLFLDVVGAVLLAAPDIRWLHRLASRLPFFHSYRFIDRCVEAASDIEKGERIFYSDTNTDSAPVSKSIFNFWCDTIEWATEHSNLECEAVARHPSAGISYLPKGGVPDEDTIYLFHPVEFQSKIRQFEARRYRIAGIILLFIGFNIQLFSQFLLLI